MEDVVLTFITEIRVFLKSILFRWWALMSCAIWTLTAIYGEKFNKTNEWYVRTSFWLGVSVLCLAAFLAWREQYRRAQQLTARRLKIVGVTPPQNNQYNTEVSGLEYRIEIINESETSSVYDAEVKLVRIEPDVPELRLPVPLEQMHDRGTPRKNSFNLNPQDHKYIDLALTRTDLTGICICHTVPGVQAVIPRGAYVLTVSATGDNAIGDTKRFRVWNTDGTLHCEMV